MHQDAPAETDLQGLSVAIGLRIRRARLDRGWTLETLAAASGLSRRSLVMVEQGGANPGIGTLLKLVNALEISLPSIVEPPSRSNFALTTAGEGAVLWNGPNGGRGVLLTAIDTPSVVELWEWMLAPGERHESDAHVPGARELIAVTEGEVTVTSGDDRIVLRRGDALRFAADQRHSYANETNALARFTLTVFEPHGNS